MVEQEILSFFREESTELLEDLKSLGESLKKVRIPDEKESKVLEEFAQKLNRLIGGTASVGFETFTALSRKTSILAEQCANIKELPIRLLVLNLNKVVSLLMEGFEDLESISGIEAQLPQFEKRIDICLSAVGIDHTEAKEQQEVDDLLAEFDL